jgi:hypothetical protein
MITRARQICIAILLAPLLMFQGAEQGSSNRAAAQGNERHAGIVIQFADGSVKTYCLAFDTETISGFDLLLKTGLPVKLEATGTMGGFICKIGPDGCDYPEQHCVCQSFGPGGVYWTYHHLKNDKWNTSVVGASSYKVRDGDVEGWAWSSGKPPALYDFERICPPPPPAPANTLPPATPTRIPPQPTALPTRRATATRPVATATIQAPTQPPAQAPETELTPTTVPTATPTVTSTVEPSPSASPTPLPSFMITPGTTEVATAMPTASPIPDPRSPSPGAAIPPTPGPAARDVAIVVALASALGFVVWRALGPARRESGAEEPEGDDVD